MRLTLRGSGLEAPHENHPMFMQLASVSSTGSFSGHVGRNSLAASTLVTHRQAHGNDGGWGRSNSSSEGSAARKRASDAGGAGDDSDAKRHSWR